ncbi:MAG: hypothetical protein QNJ97_11755 [Myxococcota bacterium]|nr:hypothetical protein [Myxococcota bacterium]
MRQRIEELATRIWDVLTGKKMLRIRDGERTDPGREVEERFKNAPPDMRQLHAEAIGLLMARELERIWDTDKNALYWLFYVVGACHLGTENIRNSLWGMISTNALKSESFKSGKTDAHWKAAWAMAHIGRPNEILELIRRLRDDVAYAGAAILLLRRAGLEGTVASGMAADILTAVANSDLREDDEMNRQLEDGLLALSLDCRPYALLEGINRRLRDHLTREYVEKIRRVIEPLMNEEGLGVDPLEATNEHVTIFNYFNITDSQPFHRRRLH